MRPSDPRLRARLIPARRPLAGVIVGSVVSGLLVIGQAFTVAGLVVAVVRDEPLGRWAVAVGGIFAARALLGLVVDSLAARAALLVGADLRRHVAAAAATGRSGLTSGELAALAARGVSAAEPYLTRYLPALVVAMVLPLLTVVAIATQDLLSAVIVLATLPLVPLFGALVGLATRDRAEAQWREMASLSGHFVDVVRGLPTLVAFRRAHAQSTRIRQITDRYRVATLRTLRVAFASSAVLELVATISVALVAVVVGVRLADGQLDLYTALVVLLLAPEAYWPLRRVGAEFHAAAEGFATYERVADLADAAPPANPSPSPGGQGGDISVQGLSVTYRDRRSPALATVSAVFPARGITAVVGPSGCGKSTLLAALMGLVEPSSGTIRVGGRAAQGEPWQSMISWVPQRPGFVAGTVAESLRLAAASATDAELWAALRRVVLEAKVRALPRQLDSQIGEDGLHFSAGERARLALARVILAERPWVFVDEPSAHLDSATEQVIARELVRLSRTAGVVTVAHRSTLVELADQVVELEPAIAQEPVPTAAPNTGSKPVAGPHSGPHPDRRIGFGLATLTSALASASGVALTATAGWLIVRAAEEPPVLTLLVAVVGVRAFGLARPVLRYVERLRSHDAALRLLAKRRVEVFDALVPLTPGRLGKRRGDLLASVVDDVESVLERELRFHMPLRAAVLVGSLALAVTAWILPLAGALVAGSFLAACALGHLLARAGGMARESAAVTARADVSARVVEVAQLAPELTMWQASEKAVDGVLAAGEALSRGARRAAAALARGRAAVLLATGAGTVGLAYVTATAVGTDQVSPPVAALLVLVPLALAEVAVPVAEAGAVAAKMHAAQHRLDELGELEAAVMDPEHPRPFPGGEREVRANGITAEWAERTVFSDLDLELAAGEKLGVVGPSGSGKSTLAALLLRFVDPAAGHVELGGVPLAELALDDVRHTVGLVDDDPHVFASTLAENIRLARPGASDAQVDRALRQARLGDWLDALPDGLDTWLGDGHAQVSGGERARLALARAVLADSPILVLDEPTAHLDLATANLVAQDLLVSTDSRSVVWITHGRAGLEHMDRVLDLSPGL